MKVSAMGLAWYRNKAEFDRLRMMFEDGNKLHQTYEEWLAAAETGVQHFETSNSRIRIVKVIIDPVEFPKWCAANGHKLNAEARMEYGNLMAMRALHDG